MPRRAEIGEVIYVALISEVAMEQFMRRAGDTSLGRLFHQSVMNLINYCKGKCFPRWMQASI
jgi:hypothetical protein